ncbi:MAG: hypothetical protein ACJAZO_004379 [Myxococcota bacterium]
MLAHRVRVGIVLLLATTPLWVWPGFVVPFVTTKVLFVRALVFVALLLWCVLPEPDIKTRSSPVMHHPIVRCVLALVGWLVVCSLFAEGFQSHIWSTMERMEGLMGWLTWLALGAVVVRTLGHERAGWLRLAYVSLGVSALVCGLALVGARGRLTGPLGSTSFLGTYVLVHGVMALSMAMRSGHRLWARLPVIGLLCLHAVVLWGTASRAALLGAAAAGVAAACVVEAKDGARWRAVGTRVAAVGAAFAVGVTGVMTTGLASSVMVSRLTHSDWMGDRPMLYASALRAVGDRPVLGWGLEGIDTALAQHSGPVLTGFTWSDRTHSVWLDWTVQGGLLAGGLAVVCALLVLRAANHPGRSLVERRALVAGVTGWCIAMSLGVPGPVDAFMAVVGVGYVVSTDPDLLKRPQDGSLQVLSRGRFVRVAVGCAAVALLYGNGRWALAARAMGRALEPETSFHQGLDALDEAVRWHGAAHPEAARIAALRVRVNGGAASEESARRAARFVSQACQAHPWDVRLQTEYAEVLGQLERPAEALAVLDATQSIAPEQDGFPFRRVGLLLELGRRQDALSSARQAHRLNPRPETSIQLATLLVASSRAAAEDLLTDIGERQPGLLLDFGLVDAATASGNEDWLVALWIRYDTPDRPVYQAKLRAFIAGGV